MAPLTGSLNATGNASKTSQGKRLLKIGECSPPQSREESSTKPPPSTITKEFRILKGGGTLGTQHSPQLDEEVDFETVGDLRMNFLFTNKACSELRLSIFLDGKLLKQTGFFDEKTGILDL